MLPAQPVEPTDREPDTTSRQRAARLAAASLVLAAAVVVGGFLAAAARDGTLAFDLRHAFLPAADQILHGHSPYPDLDAASVRAGQAFVYPPISGELLTPLHVLSGQAAGAVFTALLAFALVATLLLLDVRDVRCYAAAFLWGPVLSALQTANLTLLVALATAAAWRYRSQPLKGPWALALAVAPKLLAWPLILWAGAAGRARLAIRSLLLLVLVTAVTWAGIGFAGFTGYPHLVAHVTRLERGDSYSLYALAHELGVGSALAQVAWLVSALLLLVTSILVSRRDERRGFVLAIAAMLALTPIIWLHYFALLIVPLAISRPRFDAVWLLPVVLVGASGTGNGGLAWTIVALSVAALLVIAALVPEIRLRDLPQLVGRLRTTIVRSA